jgi:hypothetical protein
MASSKIRAGEGLRGRVWCHRPCVCGRLAFGQGACQRLIKGKTSLRCRKDGQMALRAADNLEMCA